MAFDIALIRRGVRMEQSFSQRMGYKPVKSVIQVNSMDATLRNALWNDLVLCVWRITNHQFRIELGNDIWTKFLNKPIDEIPSTDPNYYHFKNYYFQFEWFEVYDFIEFIAIHLKDENAKVIFIHACNHTLEINLSGYRFVEKRLIQITSDQEISEIEEALGVSRTYTPHLQRALELLADKKMPDYRNSIKESISAVEALCNLIAESQKATLGDALRKLDSKLGGMHSALRNAFNQLYGYTSDAQGIRHALLGESELDVEDARFMLIACSAFVNYLVAKADKAGIELSNK